MQYEINIELPEAEYRAQIEDMISTARKAGANLPLPCHIGSLGIEVAALVLSQINCTNCDGHCCRSYKFAEFGVPLLETEYQTILNRIGEEKAAKIGIKLIAGNRHLPVPCPFIHKTRCSIHDIRPIACVDYPIVISGLDSRGEKIVNLSSLCPEARRVTKSVHLNYWKLYHKVREASPQMAQIKRGVQQEEILRKSKKTEV